MFKLRWCTSPFLKAKKSLACKLITSSYALNKLYDYCKKWKLSVNIGKTKIMIFNKGGNTVTNTPFHFGNSTSEITNEYCYLGIIFVPSGSLTKAMNTLKDKASKAFFFFKIRNSLYDSQSKCRLKLFSTLILPIISYACEVWSPYLLKNIMTIILLNYVIINQVKFYILKLILGVHRKSSNHAVRGELGSHPILIFMPTLTIKYWWKL